MTLARQIDQYRRMESGGFRIPPSIRFSMDSIHVRPESLRSSEQPGCFVAAMPQAQKSTACDFGGEGECRRVGCTLPAKTAQRASTVEQVLRQARAAALRVCEDEDAADEIHDELDNAAMRKVGSDRICDSCRTAVVRIAAVAAAQRKAAAAAAAPSTAPAPAPAPAPAAVVAVRRLEKRHSLSSGELLTRTQLRTHGWEQGLQSHLRLAVFKRLPLKYGGRLAVTCKALAGCDEWVLAQQFWVPPLRKLKAELEETVQIKDAAIKEGERKIKNAGNSKSKLKIKRDVAEGTMHGGRDALIRQLQQQLLEAEQRAKSAEETSEQHHVPGEEQGEV